MTSSSNEYFKTDIQNPAKIKEVIQDTVLFSDKLLNYCIGIVDIVNSTKLTAKIPSSRLGKFYSIFLNCMSSVARRFDARVVKNVGDSIIFYFPKTDEYKTRSGLEKIVECGLTMLDNRYNINSELYKELLPPISYRVSIDYGTVVIASSEYSTSDDIFGPPVNVCCKINHSAIPNGMVVGSDLYEFIKSLSKYRFRHVTSYSSGLKLQYPVYSVERTYNHSYRTK